MSFLEQLTDNNRQIVIRLPYRVGLLVSQSDTTGGSEADERERQVLSSIIHGYAEEFFGSENIQHIMSATIRERSDWPKWGDNLSAVPEECRIAIDLLRQYGDGKDANAFKTHLMEISEAVAGAFREQENASVFSAFGMYVSYMFAGTRKGHRKKSFSEFLNVSNSERRVLNAIAQALEAA